MIVDVFRASSPSARRIFAAAGPNNVMQFQLPCTAIVNVSEDHGGAYFEESYDSETCMHRPYMVVTGTVSEVYIEDDDPRVFPCGAKRLRIKKIMQGENAVDDSIDVTIRWRLTAEEISYLYSIGLGYSDFGPPDMIYGNQIEIPLMVLYKACYDSPICAVDIIDPDAVPTTTKSNAYDTIFMSCEPSALLALDKQNGGLDVDYNRIKNKEVPEYTADYIDNSAEVTDVVNIPDGTMIIQPEVEDPVVAQQKEEDANIANDIRVKLDEAADRYATDREAPVDTDKIITELRQESSSQTQDTGSALNRFAQRRAAKTENSTLKISDKIEALKQVISKISDDDGANTDQDKQDENTDVITDMTNYSNNDDSAESKHEKAEKENKKAIDRQTQLDVAQDNKALNEGITDIAGFGADVETSDSKAENEHKKAEKENKDAIERQRRLDVAQDNLALNLDPNADISGSGASLTQNLLNDVLPSSNDDQQYL